MSEQMNYQGKSGEKMVCEIDFSSDSGLNELKTMAKDSKFVCRSCGRAAASEESVCQPVWIY